VASRKRDLSTSRTVLIDARWPEGHQSLKGVTAALVEKRVAAIFCGNNVGALEAKDPYHPLAVGGKEGLKMS